MTDWRHTVDISALGAVIAAMLGWLPSAAALLTVVWMMLRIYNEAMEAVDNYRRHHHRVPSEQPQDPTPHD